jgi:hypothetical protein
METVVSSAGAAAIAAGTSVAAGASVALGAQAVSRLPAINMIANRLESDFFIFLLLVLVGF